MYILLVWYLEYLQGSRSAYRRRVIPHPDDRPNDGCQGNPFKKGDKDLDQVI